MTRFAMPKPHPVMNVLLSLTGFHDATVELTADTLSVRMGRAWDAEIARTSIRSATHDPTRTISIGAHGWRGRWLVNTTTSNLVVLTAEPAARGRCLGVPISVRELRVSLADPDAFLGELGAPTR